MKYLASLTLVLIPTLSFAAVQSNITTSVDGTTVHLDTATGVHDVQIQNVQVVNGEVQVETTVDGKTIKTISTPSGNGTKTTVTVDGVTRVFEGALPTEFATITADGSNIRITGDTVTITKGEGGAQSFSKIQLSNEVSSDEGGMRTIRASKAHDSAVFTSLLSVGAISADPVTVKSDEDLSLYAANVVSRNSDIDSAAFGGGSIDVSLRDHTKLFGVIPMNRTYHVLASKLDSDSNVQVQLPWWNIFAAKPAIAEGNTKAKLSENLKAAVTGASTTAGKQALALATIANTLQLSAEANASVETH